MHRKRWVLRLILRIDMVPLIVFTVLSLGFWSRINVV